MNKVTFGKRRDNVETADTDIILNGQTVGYIETRKTTNEHLGYGFSQQPMNPYIWNPNQWFVTEYAVVLDGQDEVTFEVGFDDNARSILAQAKRFAKAEALKLAETAETETTETAETTETEIETLQRSIADVDAHIKDLRWTQGRLTIKHMEGKQEALPKIVAIDDKVEVLAAKLKRLEDDLYEARIKAFGKSAGFVRAVGGKAYNEIQARHKRYSDKYYR